MNTRVRSLFYAILASAIIALPAHGGVISHTSFFAANIWGNDAHASSSSSSGQFGGTGYNYTSTSIARFDTSLGTLTGVTVSLDSNWGIQQTLRVSDSVAENGVATAAGAMQSNSYYNVSQFSGLGNRFFSGSGALDFAHCVSVVVGPYAECNDNNNNYGNKFLATLVVPEVKFGTFTGPGSVNFDLEHSTSINGACNYNGVYDAGDDCTDSYNDSFWSGNLTLTYTYDPTPVPGPASLFLIASGLILLRNVRAKHHSLRN